MTKSPTWMWRDERSNGRFRGELIAPGDPGYDRRAGSGMRSIDKRPAVIVRPRETVGRGRRRAISPGSAGCRSPCAVEGTAWPGRASATTGCSSTCR